MRIVYELHNALSPAVGRRNGPVRLSSGSFRHYAFLYVEYRKSEFRPRSISDRVRFFLHTGIWPYGAFSGFPGDSSTAAYTIMIHPGGVVQWHPERLLKEMDTACREQIEITLENVLTDAEIPVPAVLYATRLVHMITVPNRSKLDNSQRLKSALEAVDLRFVKDSLQPWRMISSERGVGSMADRMRISLPLSEFFPEKAGELRNILEGMEVETISVGELLRQSLRRDVEIPDVGEADSVEVVELCVALGDVIEVDDPIVIIESDKASMEVLSPFAGTLHDFNVQPGDLVNAGDIVATVISKPDG